ncbi:MAG: hypothetical protein ACTHM4_06100 [Rhodanobacteraceae bacterium]
MSEVEAGVEGRAWTRREVELVVNVHLHMLRMQLMGQTPNKAEHNRQLQTMLPARSKASIDTSIATSVPCWSSRASRRSLGAGRRSTTSSSCWFQLFRRPSDETLFGRSRASSGRDTCRGAAAGFVRTFRRCAARRPKAFNAVALNGGARIDNIRKAHSRVSATVYTSPDASRCAFSSTAVVSLQ